MSCSSWTTIILCVWIYFWSNFNLLRIHPISTGVDRNSANFCLIVVTMYQKKEVIYLMIHLFQLSLLYTSLSSNVPVIHNVTMKWFDTFNQTTYPDYMLGSGYAVGSRILNYVALNRENLPLYSNEDASVGIWIQVLGSRRWSLKNHGANLIHLHFLFY